MAKVKSNLIIQGLSGMLGKQLVLRHRKDGTTVVATAPQRPRAVLSAAQKAHVERFRQAILYSRSAKTRPEYAALARARGISAHLVAVADFMHPPRITALDVSNYRGQVGQIITITAVDDVKVASVAVSILAADGSVVEHGEAVPSATNPDEWSYATQVRAPTSELEVRASATDLANQVGRASASASSV